MLRDQAERLHAANLRRKAEELRKDMIAIMAATTTNEKAFNIANNIMHDLGNLAMALSHSPAGKHISPHGSEIVERVDADTNKPL